MPGDPCPRELYVSKEVWEAVNEPWADNWMGQRHKAFRAVLDSFTRGDWLSISENPDNKEPHTTVARVRPVEDEIWDIRCPAPEAMIRCFGAFGGFDLFVCLTWQYREDLNTNEDWCNEIERCKSEWHRLFDPIERFRGASLDEYLSNYWPA